VGCSVQQDQREIEHEQGRTKDGVVSFRYVSGINKPGFNPLAAQTSTNTYLPYLYTWGGNNYGQLGLGNRTNYSSPKQVGSLTTWLTVVSGNYYSTAIKNDGTLWTWGQNQFGQLAQGNTTNYSSPKQVGALTNWLSLASGYAFAIAIKTDGTLWSWGRNLQGQLGLGNTTNYSSPKQVGSLTAWSQVSCSANTTFVIKTDGTLWSWGSNSSGALGIGNTTNYSSPKQIGALTTWAYVAAKFGGGNFGLAIKTDGTLWSWGLNTQGQLGLGNTTAYSSPKQIGALTAWAKPFIGSNESFATKTDGTLWCWGRNNFGQLALGNNTNYSSPKQLGALTNWLAVAGGGYTFNAAIKTDGTIWSWGANSTGQLGLGNITPYSSPKQVGSLTNWLSISAGYYTVLATIY
jgi:alpha-tubulin suppressor-like RCC1 family protein